MLLLPLFLILIGTASTACADYYKYTDASGSVNITNTLESVPAKYRSKMKVIKDDAPSQKDAGARKQSQVVEESQPAAAPETAPASAMQDPETGKFQELSARFIWFKPLAIVVAVLACFLIVIKISSLVSSPQLSKLIYLGFFFGVFLFVYKTYMEELVSGTKAVKEQAIATMKKANVREVPSPSDAPPETK